VWLKYARKAKKSQDTFFLSLKYSFPLIFHLAPKEEPKLDSPKEVEGPKETSKHWYRVSEKSRLIQTVFRGAEGRTAAPAKLGGASSAAHVLSRFA